LRPTVKGSGRVGKPAHRDSTASLMARPLTRMPQERQGSPPHRRTGVARGKRDLRPTVKGSGRVLKPAHRDSGIRFPFPFSLSSSLPLFISSSLHLFLSSSLISHLSSLISHLSSLISFPTLHPFLPLFSSLLRDLCVSVVKKSGSTRSAPSLHRAGSFAGWAFALGSLPGR